MYALVSFKSHRAAEFTAHCEFSLKAFISLAPSCLSRAHFNMQGLKTNLCLFLLLPVGTVASVDVRLVDATGNLASVGLVQIKTDTGFGSVCGANPAAADVICRSLGYAHGIVSSSPCAFYGAANMCGAPGSPVV